MGTAALAVAAFRLPGAPGPVQTVSDTTGWILLVVAAAGMVLLCILNLIQHTPRGMLWQDLRSRDRGPAYAAIPGAVLVLVLAVEAGSPGLLDDMWGGWLLLGITLTVSAADLFLTWLFFASAIANRHTIEQDALSGVWFMPQTVLLLSATTLARLSISPHPGIADVAAPAAVLFLGAGFMLFLFIGALVLGRLVAEPLDARVGVPAAWIMMSPASAAALAFLAIPLVIPTLLSAPPLAVTFMTSLVAGALVGFALWWLIVVGALTLRLRRSALAFSPASWSFVFPLAAVAVASGELAHVWDSQLMVVLAIGMAALGTAVWVWILGESLMWIRARLNPAAAIAE